MLLKLINEKTEFRLADFMNCRRNNLSLADLVKMCFIMTPKRPNNPPNLCDNNNIMKVTPLVCSPESQNND